MARLAKVLAVFWMLNHRERCIGNFYSFVLNNVTTSVNLIILSSNFNFFFLALVHVLKLIKLVNQDDVITAVLIFSEA